jgi:proteasome lid subunit RPN8/RPN11
MKWFSKRNEKSNSVPHEWFITKQCLSMICESAKSTYPNEFAGFLRVDDEKKHIITEVVLIPGTISGSHHALYKMHMIPVDFNIIGTVHSHPSGSFHPSEADLQLFQHFGKVHIIAAEPYSFESWKGYDGKGDLRSIRII